MFINQQYQFQASAEFVRAASDELVRVTEDARLFSDLAYCYGNL